MKKLVSVRWVTPFKYQAILCVEGKEIMITLNAPLDLLDKDIAEYMISFNGRFEVERSMEIIVNNYPIRAEALPPLQLAYS